VHLINDTGDKRLEGAPGVQDFSAIHGIHVRLQWATRPTSVLLGAEKKSMAFEWKDGWAWFEAPPLVMHDAYMVQY
jgi:hypothetical protein